MGHACSEGERIHRQRHKEREKEYLWCIILVNGESSNTLLIKRQEKFASDLAGITFKNFQQNCAASFLSKFVLAMRVLQLPHTYPQILYFVVYSLLI